MNEQDRVEFEAWFDKQDYGGEVPPSRLAIKILKTQLYGAWLAARRTQDAKVRELVEAAEETVRMGLRGQNTDEATSEYDIHKLQEALAQLKEQNDEHEQR